MTILAARARRGELLWHPRDAAYCGTVAAAAQRQGGSSKRQPGVPRGIHWVARKSLWRVCWKRRYVGYYSSLDKAKRALAQHVLREAKCDTSQSA